MEKRVEDRALELFDSGYNCCQSVFAAAAPGFGLSEDLALGASAALGGGIARTGKTCGALTGALMALGLSRGKTGPDPESKRATYEAAGTFLEAFRTRCGSTICSDLIGCDLSTEEGRAEAARRNTHGTVCRGIVRTAAEMLSGR